jgi:hypothetical protein
MTTMWRVTRRGGTNEAQVILVLGVNQAYVQRKALTWIGRYYFRINAARRILYSIKAEGSNHVSLSTVVFVAFHSH